MILESSCTVISKYYYVLCFVDIQHVYICYNINDLENCSIPHSRGLGLKMLYYYFINYIKVLKYYAILETPSSNFNSLSLYYLCNFQIIFIRKQYYKKNSENCFTMLNTKISSINFWNTILLVSYNNTVHKKNQ
nr:hypothetical protein [Erythrocladia irregularis]